MHIVVVGSARERELVAPILAANAGTVSLVGRTTVPELAAVAGRWAASGQVDGGGRSCAPAAGAAAMHAARMSFRMGRREKTDDG